MLNRISTADSYRVIKALEIHFVVDDPEKKLGHYKIGWSDALIARKLGTNISFNHVSRIRVQMFGHIMNAQARAGIAKSRSATASFPADNDHSRVASLERIVLQLANNTTERFDKLEATLSKLLADLGVAEEVAENIVHHGNEHGNNDDEFSATNP